MTGNPDYPDTDHAGVGPNQAVATITACRTGGAKSDRHNNTPSPHRWGQIKPPPWGQFRLSRPPVVCRLQIGPERAPTDLGHHLIGQRLDVERWVAPRAAHVPRRGAARLLEIEGVYQPIVRIPVQPQRVVE